MAGTFDVIEDHAALMSSSAIVRILMDLRAGDSVSLNLTSNRSGARFIVDLISNLEVDAYTAARPRIFGGYQDRGRAIAPPVSLQRQITAAGGYNIMVMGDGWTFGAAGAQVTVRRRTTPTPTERSEMVDVLRRLAAHVDGMFQAQPFRLSIAHCGERNAFSDPATGNVTLCTELLPRLYATEGVLLGVFFHEIGHSLLRIWSLPGWDQESMADDFAIFMLLQLPGGPGLATDFATFFASDDPAAEAYRIAHLGGRHPAGIQRIQNIQLRLQEPTRFMDEWNALIYPRMQTAHLRRIASAPRLYESALLANSVLARRQ